MDINSIDLTDLKQALGYHFKDESLLLQALTHTTFAYESQKEDFSDNQRLEFLGDSVLTMVTTEYLYKKYPECSEGELTRRRALLVNRDNLAKKAKEINLSQYLLLGKGEEQQRGRKNPTNLTCAFEAIIGAIYLDAGFEQACRFVRQMIISPERPTLSFQSDQNKEGISN